MSKKTTSKEKKTKKAIIGKTYYGFALDSSGSMEDIREEIMNTYNAQVEAIKATKDIKSFITLVTFGECSEPVILKYLNSTVADAPLLNEETYKPCGMTPMRDGVGRLISELGAIKLGKNDAVKITIFSDGLENNSREWSAAQLKSKIEELEALPNWTFSYVGANQDAFKVARDLGMDASNALNFNATKFGTLDLRDSMLKSTQEYTSMRSMGVTKASNIYGGKTHASDKEEEEDSVSSSTPARAPRGLINTP